MYLAREGFEVDVYEKRAEPAKEGGVDNGRAYIIILIPRGKAALEELGVELPTDPHFLTLVRCAALVLRSPLIRKGICS
eukprot:361865-Chlamydomonas_euryale.AAC.4